MSNGKKGTGILLIVIGFVLFFIILAERDLIYKEFAKNIYINRSEANALTSLTLGLIGLMFSIPLIWIGLYFTYPSNTLFSWQLNRKRNPIVAYILYIISLNVFFTVFSKLITSGFRRLYYKDTIYFLAFAFILLMISIFFYVGRSKRLK